MQLKRKSPISIQADKAEKKLWKLSSGKLVELEMVNFADKCLYEYPFYLFIMDIENESWTGYFIL